MLTDHTAYSLARSSTRAGLALTIAGPMHETDCVGHSLDRNKDNNYSSDKCGAYGSAGPTVIAYVAVA